MLLFVQQGNNTHNIQTVFHGKRYMSTLTSCRATDSCEISGKLQLNYMAGHPGRHQSVRPWTSDYYVQQTNGWIINGQLERVRQEAAPTYFHTDNCCIPIPTGVSNTWPASSFCTALSAQSDCSI